MNGIIKLIALEDIRLYKFSSKFEAIRNVNGGPKITQHMNAIKQSAHTKTKIFFLLEKFLSLDANFFIWIILL